MAVVRQDAKGIYVVSGGLTARPGSVSGYGHAYRMDDGGLNPGDKVDARHVGGTQMVRIKLPDGRITRWFNDSSERDNGLQDIDAEAQWDDKGLRVYPEAQSHGPSPVREIATHNLSDIKGMIEQ